MQQCESESVVAHRGFSLQTLFEASPEPSLIFMNDSIVECNQAAIDILGYSFRDELLGMDPARLSPEAQPDGMCSFKKLKQFKQRAQAEGSCQFEWEHLRTDGGAFTVVVSLVALKRGDELAFYATWRDISDIKRLHESLLSSESRFQELFKAIPNGIILFYKQSTSAGFIIKNLNNSAENIFNKSRHKLTGNTLKQLFPDYKSKVREIESVMHQVWSDGEIRHYHLINYRGDHISIWLDIEFYRTPGGELVAILQNNTDKEQDRINLELYSSVYQQSKQAIIISDRNNRIISVNDSFTELTGYTEQEIKGHNPRILASGRVQKIVYEEMWGALYSQGYWQGELWDRTKDGRVYPKWISINTIRNKRDEIQFFIGSFSDISDKKAAEQKIQYLAYHDPLTQLCNRFSFEERLGQAISNARLYQREVALLLIDLDHFKDINDSLGHQIGDALLKVVAERLKPLIRESDILARLGGDEFMIALTDLPNHHVLALKAEMIQKRLSESYEVEGQTLFCTPSIGISLYPDDGQTVETLMGQADAAMYHAKAQGRKNCQYFSAEIAQSTSRRLEIGQELHSALEKGEFEIHYQPKIDMVSEKLCGLEALIRWQHPKRGLVSPVEFIPVLEDSGLIEAVGEWVVNEVSRQMAHWTGLGLMGISTAINLSARQLRSSQLTTQIKTALAAFQLPPELLELEVTESVAMDNPEQAVSILSDLNDLGIKIAIDDFGTGYSSLAYLKKLPIQTLKLDRAFVKDIETDSNDAAISAATIALAHNLGLTVVAEGVETKEQQEFLKNHQCDMSQGYLHGRPQTPQELEKKWYSEGLLKQ